MEITCSLCGDMHDLLIEVRYDMHDLLIEEGRDHLFL
uniref:Uncharacterized protein n=1 Tax=Arundo donax TaxID=35708 RepID=A0A0A9CUC8_ARUDO